MKSVALEVEITTERSKIHESEYDDGSAKTRHKKAKDLVGDTYAEKDKYKQEKDKINKDLKTQKDLKDKLNKDIKKITSDELQAKSKVR